jgi:hypothetical protein
MKGGGNCLYHTHTCPAKIRNNRLWKKYQHDYSLEFCFTCGRACKNHAHYTLTPDNRTPALSGTAASRVVDGRQLGGYWDCRGSGGGGRRELVARIVGIIEYMNTLDEKVGVKYDKELVTALTDAAEAAAMSDEKLAEADRWIRLQKLPTINPKLHMEETNENKAKRLNAEELKKVGAQYPILSYLMGAKAVRGGVLPVIDAADAAAGVGLGALRGAGALIGRGFGFMCARRAPRGAAAAAAAEAAPEAAAPAAAAAAEAAPEAAAPAAAAPARGANILACPEGHQVPEVLEGDAAVGKKCFLCELMGDDYDGRKLYRFTHNKHDDTIHRHTDEQLICTEHIIAHIKPKMQEGNLRCFINKTDGCGGVIHPCELSMLREPAVEEGDVLYRRAISVARVMGLDGIPKAAEGGARRGRRSTKKRGGQKKGTRRRRRRT